ncbi:TIR domain-containing protein [Leptolyngbya sp. AN03gr2]|uniref:TIR domain-containing protein n=1 Tax=unclassified Leptolyngbya TaxID=2650499 RepID=UPI003D31783D
MTEEPIKVFFSYSHRDEELKDELVKHLSILRRQGVITEWHDRMIMPGSEWSREIDASLNSADIILLMVSSDFLASDYCWGVEIEKALQRHESGEAYVIPVILRPVVWQDAPFAKLQALPKNAKPITKWKDQDEAFFDVVRGIQIAIETLLQVRNPRRGLKDPRKERLEASRGGLQAEWNLRVEKLAALRQALAIETSVAIEFQLKRQIQMEEEALLHLENNLAKMEQNSLTSEAKSHVVENQTEFLQREKRSLQQKIEEEKLLEPEVSPIISPVSTVYQLSQVFISSGIPTITFVEPERFAKIKLALQSGGGIVLEGPSGIGKTTALQKALEQISSPLQPEYLRARKHIEKIRTVETWHRGLAVIDDSHDLKANDLFLIADYLKRLADAKGDPNDELANRTLVILGIPETANRLIKLRFDLTMRIEPFKLGRVKDKTIESMIKKGEDALNIVFSQKLEIIAKANGSLNLAQLLCQEIALSAGIEQTQTVPRSISSDLDEVISSIMENLADKFEESVRKFLLLGGRTDSTSVTILEALATSNNGVLELQRLRDSSSGLEKAIDNFIASNYLPNLYRDSPEISRFICFHPEPSKLIIDDPQLTFYLRQLSESGFLQQMANKASSEVRNKVFVSYSHADEAKLDFFDRILTHLRPLDRDGAIDLWSDKKIKVGSYWKHEIEKALDSAKIALLLVSADFLASDFIAKNELPQLLAAAKDKGTIIIPIILSPCRLPKNISEIQAANSPSKALTSMSYHEREEVFSMIVEIIEEYLAL